MVEAGGRVEHERRRGEPSGRRRVEQRNGDPTILDRELPDEDAERRSAAAPFALAGVRQPPTVGGAYRTHARAREQDPVDAERPAQQGEERVRDLDARHAHDRPSVEREPEVVDDDRVDERAADRADPHLRVAERTERRERPLAHELAHVRRPRPDEQDEHDEREQDPEPEEETHRPASHHQNACPILT